ncbi:RNA-binding protein [Microbacterium bovistercoris]|uniref:RNA-binding protein n=1 Tax=Microbacterium bovistercoris TaxID=2293570 RepID=A0A371NZB6_9MICO|nr:RNA-binding protein [Microbacterium bovistercoris]REJ08053.1 RNA-binding protein [Microbacterium bovistercoris]
MGLNIPADLGAWQRWQRSRHRLRMLRDVVRRPSPPQLQLLVRGEDPVVLFALEATTPTAIASIAEPMAHLGDTPMAVLAPADVSAALPGEWRQADAPQAPRSMRAVIATGHFLAAGALAYQWACEADARFFVVQHGLLAPQAPPLPSGAHVLAFTDRDFDFWRSGRTDVTGEAIGSQLLWNAAHQPPRALRELSETKRATVSDTPIFLGQLHGAELPRRVTGRTAELFCRQEGALYRPHPAETDLLSRRQHAKWQRNGIRFAEPGPLLQSGHSVVSIFSTGVLEAAAAGIPSWVTCVNPPAWVHEFWERYELAAWGGTPTRAPVQPDVEPSERIAQIVLATVRGES